MFVIPVPSFPSTSMILTSSERFHFTKYFRMINILFTRKSTAEIINPVLAQTAGQINVKH